jgi:ketosteroid isomerase-like protein
MKNLTSVVTLSFLGMFLTTVVMADDVEDVKAAVQRYFAAINAGDFSTVMQYRSLERSSFSGPGGLLDVTTSSLQEQKNALDAQARSGVKRNYRITHMDVKVYGNTAVVTGYLTGSRTQPNGTVAQMRDRRTGVFVKQGGQWKEVHRHQSPLRLPQ